MFKLVKNVVRGFRISVYGEKTVAYQDAESLSDQAMSTLKSVSKLEKSIAKCSNKSTLTGKLAARIQQDVVEELDA